MNKKIVILVSSAGVIFCLALGVWLAPVLFKGYTPTGVGTAVVLARNYAQQGIFGVESKLNVVLAPALVKDQAQISTEGNKLTTYFYALIFKIFSVPNSPEKIILWAALILALSVVSFFLAVYHLSGLKIAWLFSIFYIFLPFEWLLPTYATSYDVALFLLSVFWLLFIFGLFKKIDGQPVLRQKADLKAGHYVLFFCAGIFLALSGMAREAMFFLPLILFIYLIYHKRYKILFSVFFAFLVVVAIWWLPSFFRGGNSYSLLFFNENDAKIEQGTNFGVYAHLYPDPYTFHFDKENFLNEYNSLRQSNALDSIGKLGNLKVAVNMGQDSVNLLERSKIGLSIMVRHLGRFVSLEETGGPIILLFMVLGFIWLRKRIAFFANLSLWWIGAVVLLLSFVTLAQRSHLMDFGWVLAVFLALGVSGLAAMVSQSFALNRKKETILLIFLTLIIVYNLVLSAHIIFGRIYDDRQALNNKAYAEKILQKNIGDIEVVAMPENMPYDLNFLTNKSVLVFRPQTIEKLIKEKKLQSAFDSFNVKYIVGYGSSLTKEIVNNAKVENISEAVDVTDAPSYYNKKNWLLNLFK